MLERDIGGRESAGARAGDDRAARIASDTLSLGAWFGVFAVFGIAMRNGLMLVSDYRRIEPPLSNRIATVGGVRRAAVRESRIVGSGIALRYIPPSNARMRLHPRRNLQ
jgi:hypothetical protein